MVRPVPNNSDSVLSRSPIVYYEWYMVDNPSSILAQGENADVMFFNMQTPGHIGVARLVITLENGCKQAATIEMPPANSNARMSRANKASSYGSNLTVYPIPADNILRVSYESDIEQSTTAVSIYDSTGKVLLNQMLAQGNSDIDISSLDDGVYFLLLPNEQLSTVFVVQHQ